MTFIARYNGKCGGCGDPIDAGTTIRRDDETGAYVHDSCPDDVVTATPAIEHPVCPACWLTHPEGACDR